MQPYIELTRKWREFGQGDLTAHDYTIALNATDKARLASLVQRYPRLHENEIIRDLLAAALQDLEQSIPYQQGSRVIAVDECGDEIYEDSGLTPEFLRLTKHFQSLLRNGEKTESTSEAS